MFRIGVPQKVCAGKRQRIVVTVTACLCVSARGNMLDHSWKQDAFDEFGRGVLHLCPQSVHLGYSQDSGPEIRLRVDSLVRVHRIECKLLFFKAKQARWH